MPAVPLSRASVMTFQAPASSSSRIHSTHWYGAKIASASFDPTSESTRKSRAKRSISSSLRSRGRVDGAVGDLDAVEAVRQSQVRYSSMRPRASAASSSVPPQTTGSSRSR